MPTDNDLEHQKRIASRVTSSNGGPAPDLTANQAAARLAVRALVALTALVGTIRIKNTSLAGLDQGAEQLTNDDGLWALAEVDDWMAFENHLGRAAAALYCAAQMRGQKLHLLAKARADLDAEIRRRG